MTYSRGKLDSRRLVVGVSNGKLNVPRLSMPFMTLAVKRALLGVGKCGLQLVLVMGGKTTQGAARREKTNLASLSRRKFCDRSAARLAAGDEPRDSLAVK